MSDSPLGDIIKGIDIETAISALKKLGVEGKDLEETLEKLYPEVNNVAEVINKSGYVSKSNVGFIDKLKTAYSGLATTLHMTTGMLTGVITGVAAFMAVAYAVKAYQDYIEECVANAREDATAYAELSDSIESYSSRIDELRKRLEESNLSEEEEYQIKSELLSIQQELSDSYGDQVKGIDLINGAVQEQIDLLNELTETEARRFLNANKTGIAEAKSHMEKEWLTSLGSIEFDPDDSKYIAEVYRIAEKYSDTIGITHDYVASNSYAAALSSDGKDVLNITFNGTAEEADETINAFVNELQDAIGNSGSISLDSLFTRTDSFSALIDDELATYHDLYRESIEATLVTDRNRYGLEEKTAAEWLSNYATAIEEYNNAIASGDSEEIAVAEENFAAIDATLKSMTAEGGAMNQYIVLFQDAEDQLNSAAIAQRNFLNALINNVDVSSFANNLKDTGFSDIDLMYAFETDGLQEGEEQLMALIKAAQTLGLISGETTDDVRFLLDVLVDAGYIAGVNSGALSDINKQLQISSDNTNDIMSGISDVTSIIAAQSSGKSLSYDDFNTENLAAYSEALEYHNGVLQLNTEKVNELVKANAEEQIAYNDTQKAMAQAKYLKNARDIEVLRETAQNLRDENDPLAESYEQSANALLRQNEQLRESCTQYDLMSASLREATGEYQHWLNSQDSSQTGDMFDDTLDALTHIDDTLNNTESEFFGRIGRTDYKAAVDLILPDSIDATDQAAVNKYLDDIAYLFTYDEDGNRSGLDMVGFLDKAVEAGYFIFDEAAKEYRLLGSYTMEEIAAGMELSLPLVQAIFGEMEEYGGVFSWADEAAKTIGDYAVAADVARERLLENDPEFDIKLDYSNVRDLSNAIDDLIKKRDAAAEADKEYYNDIISYYVLQKHILEDPAVLKVDTSTLSDAQAEAITLFQNFIGTGNKIELMASLGLDTTRLEEEYENLYNDIISSDNDYIVRLDISDYEINDIAKIAGKMDEGDLNDLFGVTEENYFNAEATVTYQLDSTAVDIYNPPDLTRYVDYYYRVHDKALVMGSANAFGTAHASGTACAGGNWGTAPGGKTLVGELGREIVVDPHTGRWYTVGDTGAEFRDIPRGAIVFNHKQSESLLKNGYVASRAMALASGTALIGGTALSKGSLPTIYDSTSSGAVLGFIGSIGLTNAQASSSGSGENGSSGANASNSSSTTNDDSELEIFDWIEVAISRIERVIDRLKTTATSTYKALKTKLGAAYDQISEVNKELSLQEQAYTRYLQEANSVGLSSELAALVQTGEIDITKYDEETQKLISDYQGWYEKALDCSDAIQQLHEDLASLYEDNFNNIQDDFDNQLGLLEHMKNTYETGIDILEAQGYLESTQYYSALQDIERQNIDLLNSELASLRKSFSEAMASGEIEEGSEAWFSMQSSINDVKEQIDEANLSLLEYAQTMREIEWEHFDYGQERIAQLTQESDFLIDLMSNSDMHTDEGKLTDEGMATIGLHGMNYNVYMNQADQYAAELLKINQQLAEDPYNTELIERREELLGLQQDSILAAEDEKQAIIDMVRDGIDLELESLQNLIDTYTEALDSAKALSDYQDKIKDHTSEISSLRKQLFAYDGDLSEETQAKVQQLKVQLAEAESDLEETQYDQYISDQKKLLDELYSEYEAVLNARFDNTDALFAEMIGAVNSQATAINTTLSTTAGTVGYTMSENLKTVWDGTAKPIYDTLAIYCGGFDTKLTTIALVLGNIQSNTAAMITNSNNAADSNVGSASSTTAPEIIASANVETPATETTTTAPPSSAKEYPYGKASETTGDIASGSGNHVKAIQYALNQLGYGNEGTFDIDGIYGYMTAQAVMAFQRATGIPVDGIVGDQTRAQFKLKEYKTGGLVDYTGLAKLDGTYSKPEMVLDAQDTANFIALKETLQRMTEQGISLSSSYGIGYVPHFSGITDISKKIASIRDVSGINAGVNVGDTQITIEIDHVEDYNDFVAQLQKDKKFEQFVQSMTVDRLVGGTSLKKNKYQFGN